MFTIRRYRPEDDEAIVALHRAALSAIGALFPGPWDDDFHNIAAVYVEAGGDFFVGELDGSIVAMGALRRIDSRVGEIKRMRVLPRHQRRGLGQQILDALERRAIELGFASLELDATTNQIAARAFYEKNGYRVVATRQSPHAEQVILRKKLA
jgi:ribosomal protein S18 acetylase RimI-like enzyme